jgi:hypothetical protein
MSSYKGFISIKKYISMCLTFKNCTINFLWLTLLDSQPPARIACSDVQVCDIAKTTFSFFTVLVIIQILLLWAICQLSVSHRSLFEVNLFPKLMFPLENISVAPVVFPEDETARSFPQICNRRGCSCNQGENYTVWKEHWPNIYKDTKP